MFIGSCECSSLLGGFLGRGWMEVLTRVGLSDFRYYEGGVSSVYFWDLDDGFAGVVLLKKSMRFSIQLLWCSVQHVVRG